LSTRTELLRIGRRLDRLMRHLLFCYIDVKNIEFSKLRKRLLSEAVFENVRRKLLNSCSDDLSYIIERISVTAGLQRLLKKEQNLARLLRN
jgi:hypothetical protein